MPGEVILERHRADRISAFRSESATLLKFADLLGNGNRTSVCRVSGMTSRARLIAVALSLSAVVPFVHAAAPATLKKTPAKNVLNAAAVNNAAAVPPHYGIHGTPVPSTIGKTSSHGCVRLTNWDAIELSNMVTPGTVAVLAE